LKSQSEELLKLLTLNLPDMLWIKDLNGTYIYANKALCDGLLMAKDIEEPIGKNDVFFAIREREAHKEDPNWHTFGELCFNSDVTVIENNKPMRFEEYGNVKGKMLYLEVFKAPFYDDNGNVLGTVGTGRDITELKNAQKSLEVFNEKLEEKVTQEVQKQQNQQEMIFHQSRQAAMGEMLESIAHQWRQPLNIMGLAIANIETQLLLREIPKNELMDKLQAIATNINYLSDTIDDFRAFLNPYADSQDAYFKPTKSIAEILKILDAQLKNTHINIQTNMETTHFTFKGVENEFKQVLFIIFNNAIDAIKKRINDQEIQNGEIKIDLTLNKEYGEVKIFDNGGGIEDEIKESIFEPYFTTKHKSSGTGLGLYIAKKIIESRMRGSIEVTDTDDGVCFCVKLPIH